MSLQFFVLNKILLQQHPRGNQWSWFYTQAATSVLYHGLYKTVKPKNSTAFGTQTDAKV